MGRAVLVAAAVLGLAGCVGGVGSTGSGSNSTDAAVSGGNVDAPKLVWIDAAPGMGNNLPCKSAITPAPTLGHHNTGQSCMQGCHNHNFTVAGTLYTNDTGNTGFGGAHVTLTDNNNVEHDLVVNNDGNFYTKEAVAFPVLVIASACPSAVKMSLASSDGNCNKAGCHVGSTSSQMHLP